MPGDARLRWTLASAYGIQVDEQSDAWWSGHVTDILELDGGSAGLLVATEMGGVWTVSTGNQSLPLSDSWDQPNVNALAAGPDGPRHFFAACDGGIIYETDVSTAVPLFHWHPITPALPAGAGDVNGIAVIAQHRILVAACDGGLYWSRIPQRAQRTGCLGILLPLPSTPVGSYDWQRALEPALQQDGYFQVAIGSLSGRVERAGAEALDRVSIVAGGRNAGVFLGRFTDPATLRLERARYFSETGLDLTDWWFLSTGHTSVTACERFPSTMYSLCAYPDGRLKMVLRSTDGGRTWRQTEYALKGVAGKTDLRDVAGEQGNGWNNCIGVLPTGPGIVAIGWQAGTFVSPDAGKTWIYSGDSLHLHADVHVVRFRPTTADDRHLLLIGSDGGIAELGTDDLFDGRTTARSDFNRQLPTLQCYGTWPIPRQFYGTLSVSSRHPLVATGLQDNGNVYADLDAGEPWRRIDGGDGGWTGFVGDEGFARNIMGEAVTLGRRQGRLLAGAAVVPWTLPAPGDPAGVKGPVADVVRVPRYRNARDERLVAVAGSGSTVFGLFAEDDHAAAGHWEVLGMLPAGLVVGAVGSHSGGTVHVGSTSGRFFALDTRQGSLLELPVKLPRPLALTTHDGGVPTRIVTLSETDTFALLNATSRELNYVLRLDTLTWAPPRNSGLPTTLPFYGLDGALQEDRRVLLAVTDDHVYYSDDGGDNWTQESTGLPRRVHGADLRVSIVPGRGGWATMGTFGRSVYRAWLGGGVHFG